MAAAEWSLVFDSDLKSSIFKSFFSLKGQHLQSCQIAIFFFENLFDPPDCSRARPNLTSSQLSAAAFEAEIFLHSACSTTDGRLHILIVVRDRGRGNNNTFPGPQKTFFYYAFIFCSAWERKWASAAFEQSAFLGKCVFLGAPALHLWFYESRIGKSWRLSLSPLSIYLQRVQNPWNQASIIGIIILGSIWPQSPCFY